MEMLWQSSASAIREVLARSGIQPGEIAGIGNTGHGNGVYLLDKQGQPLRNGIQSMDSRAADVVTQWNQCDLHARVFPFTIQSFWPAQPNALLVWLKKHEPQNYERIGAVLMVKDYIRVPVTHGAHGRLYRHERRQPNGYANRCFSRELMALYDLSETIQCPAASEAQQ